MSDDPRTGLTVTHRRYVTHGEAHYGGGLVDGAYVLGLFGDVATEACVRMDGDEGLFASYSDVQFRAPVMAGDMIEISCVVTSVGRRSRRLSFEARVTCRADPSRGPSAARVLDPPLVAVTATGTVVVPAPAELTRHSWRMMIAVADYGGRRYSCPVHVVPATHTRHSRTSLSA
ncbi:MAG: 3-aminobutyryl-CoA ammonia-lyase [Nocardiopsaceae bacterium]|nr:3-aminobutyryl-CoA ammonia-lyase [Nocardiopsaceae bacterium]